MAGAGATEEAREDAVEARALLPTAEEGDEGPEQPGGKEDEEVEEGVDGGAAGDRLPEEDAGGGEAVSNPGREASYGTVSSAMFMSGATDGARWVGARNNVRPSLCDHG